MLAGAILRHRLLTLVSAVRAVLRAADEYMPEEEEELLQSYTDSLNMVPNGFWYISRDGVPLLGLGPLELFTKPCNSALPTRCAVWDGVATLAKRQRRGEY